MGRSPCCEKVGLKKGPWTPEEDQKLLAFIEQHGHGSWRALPIKAGLQRCGKSCRLRWTNYLRPDIKRGKFSLQEEQTIIQLHALLGNRWSAIATHLPKRTDNEIKNYWNTTLKKRLTKMGIDPVTHKPCSGSLHASVGLSHMAQWESARLEAEARLVRESKLLPTSCLGGSGNKNPLPAVARPPCLDVLKAWQAQMSSPSSCNSALSAIMALSGDHQQESPTSTLSFPPGSCMFPTAMNIQIPPLNDMSYYNVGQWSGPGGHEEGFPELLVGEYENCLKPAINGTYVGDNYVAGGEDSHGTDIIVSDDNKTHWNNILMDYGSSSFSASNNVVF